MSLTLEAAVGRTLETLDRVFGGARLDHVSFRLWGGTLWPDDRPREATIVLKQPGSLRAMLASGNATGLAEAFVHGDFDVEGNLEQAIEVAMALENRPGGWLESLKNLYHVLRLPAPAHGTNGHGGRWSGSRHSVRRDRDVISFHYDVSNDFYQLFLDAEMVYSCAYFETRDTPLDEAQRAKLEMLCRKLRLRPGQRLLDIGCGWGGLARHAARTHGVEVVGVTLSARQEEIARRLAHDQGLAGQIRIELRDYRELSGEQPFDAVVSVGMAEHVGRENLPEYFRTARSLLKPGGVFLNHAIGEGIRPRQFSGPSFIDRHVFPDSDIPPIPLVLKSAGDAGLEVRDVENLREHYMLTLRHWVRRLEANAETARSLVGEETFRIWRLYMAASAQGFERGHLAIYQTLLSRPGPSGRSRLPLTRRAWYRAGSPEDGCDEVQAVAGMRHRD